MDRPALAIPSDVRAAIASHTALFVASDDKAGFVPGRAAYMLPMSQRLTRETAVLRALLSDGLGLANLGRFEKTAWEYAFRFDGVEASIALRKFGIRLYLDRHAFSDRVAAVAAARRIELALAAALTVLEQDFLEVEASQQLAADNVTVLNQAWRLREMYTYFQEGGTLAYAGRGRIPVATPGGGTRIFREEIEGFYNTVAMVNAYFSWLEHVLTLSLPFLRHVERPELQRFLKKRWRQKFDTVFPPSADRRADMVRTRLGAVADQIRNPHVHGSLDLRSGAVGFHVGSAGVAALELGALSRSPSLFFVPFDVRGHQLAERAFRRTDQLLATHPTTRDAVEWVTRGLDVAFDPVSRRRYQGATGADFEDFLDAMEYLDTQAVNMDW